MDEQLLIRFLTHTCTPEDLRSIDQWIASGKPNADWLFEMERIWSLKDELRFSDRREIEEAYNRKVCQNSHLLFYAQSPDFHKLGLCYNLKILYL